MEYAQLNQGPNKQIGPSCANELGHLANGVGAGMPSGTDTIRIMKHTDLPTGCNSMYRWHQITLSGTNAFASRLAALHRLPMLRTSVAENWHSQVVSTSR
jgi:hypothetical protein